MLLLPLVKQLERFCCGLTWHWFHVKEAKADLKPEETPEQFLVGRMSDLTKRLKKSKAWNDRKKRDRITKLLDELERLTGEN